MVVSGIRQWRSKYCIVIGEALILAEDEDRDMNDLFRRIRKEINRLLTMSARMY